MATSDATWVEVLPSMRDFGVRFAREASVAATKAGKQLSDELTDAATDAGQKAARNLGKGISKASADVQKVADALEKARAREADAAGRVRVAEQRLNEVRSNAKATGSQLAAAEERLATAQRGLETATRGVASQTQRYEQAQAEAASATDKTARSSRGAQDEMDGFGFSLGDVAKQAATFAAGVLAIGGAMDTASAALEKGALGDKLAAQLGATPEMSAEFGQIAGSLYTQAYGESLGEVNDAIRGVMQAGLVMEDASAEQIQNVTAKVLDLSKAFGVDLTESTQAVGQLMKTGLAPDAATALDIVTRGFQQGADRAGDFMDTLTEYSVQFQKFGLDGAMATGLLVQGMQAGARNSDLVADAIKEFSIRAVDGSKLTADGFRMIGLDARQMAAQIARGGPEAQAGLDLVLDRLRAMPDPVMQSQAAVALFGTQAEDLGQALFALDPSRAVGALGQVGGAAEKMGQTLNDNAAMRLEAFKRSVQSSLVDFFGNTVIPALEGAFGWLRDNSGWLVPLTLGFGTFFALFVGVPALITGVTTALTLLRTGILAVNLAIAANPVGFIVSALIALGVALVYAWNHSETFRAVVIAAWQGIQKAALWAWDNALKPAFDGIMVAVRAVGDFFTWLWTGVFVPAWQGITAAASWAWSTVLKPVFDAIWFGIRFLGAVIFTLYVLPWQLAFKAVAALALWLWDVALRPTFDAISWGLGKLGEFFGWVHATLIKPAWDAVGFAVEWVWQNRIMPAFELLKLALRAVGDFFGWVYSALIKPSWDAAGAAIRWVYDWVIRPSWEALKLGLRSVGDFFRWVYETLIKPSWDAVGAVVRWVNDNAVQPAFNAVRDALRWVGEAFQNTANWIGDAWGRVAEFASKPVGFVVNTVYNDGIRPVWNWIQDKFGLNLALPERRVAFSGGGVLSGYAPGRDIVPAMLSPGEAVLTPEAVRYLGPSTVLALNAGTSGRPPATGPGTVHAAGGWLSDAWAKASSIAGGVWGGIKDIGSAIADLTSNPLEWIRGQLRPFTDGLAQFGNSPWVQAMTAMPRKFIDAAVEKVKAAFVGGGAYGQIPVGDVGGGVQRWSGLVLQALAMMGQPASYLGITLRRMNQESGGNPNIGNYWDVNAQRGTPSMGLMQVIGPTFSAYRDPRAPNNILDPLANILASMRYALSRYGSLPAAYNKPGGYKNGGWLMPGEFAYNETRKPEPILSSEQWSAFQRSAGSSNSITVNAKTDASPDHIAHTIDRHISMSARL